MGEAFTAPFLVLPLNAIHFTSFVLLSIRHGIKMPSQPRGLAAHSGGLVLVACQKEVSLHFPINLIPFLVHIQTIPSYHLSIGLWYRIPLGVSFMALCTLWWCIDSYHEIHYDLIALVHCLPVPRWWSLEEVTLCPSSPSVTRLSVWPFTLDRRRWLWVARWVPLPFHGSVVQQHFHFHLCYLQDHKVRLYALSHDTLREGNMLEQGGAITDLKYSPDGAYLASADDNRKVVLYELPSYNVSPVACLLPSPFRSLTRLFLSCRPKWTQNGVTTQPRSTLWPGPQILSTWPAED